MPTGTSCRTTRIDGGGPTSIFAMTAWGVGAVTGGSPASISYATTARAYSSLRPSICRSPLACSGLM
jgi:hypothetical protein